MTTQLTATRLRAELFRTLDEVLSTGVPVEIERPGGAVRIIRDNASGRLAGLTPHPGTINGDAEELARLSWEQDWKP